MKEGENKSGRVRKVLNWLGLSLVSIAALLLLLAGAFWYWVNDWQRLERPEFHSGWSAAQQADLVEIDNFWHCVRKVA